VLLRIFTIQLSFLIGAPTCTVTALAACLIGVQAGTGPPARASPAGEEQPTTSDEPLQLEEPQAIGAWSG
jgi:hypothetical protein